MTDDIRENGPDLWKASFPSPQKEGHKYHRGHALIFTGGLTKSGASRLAARAALRTGAGLVTLAVPGKAIMAHVGRAPDALMIRRANGPEEYADILKDERFNALLIGPAFGVGENTIHAVEGILAANRNTVLDADALTSFEGKADKLAALIKRNSMPVVLTPHAGEFAKLFEQIADLESRTDQAVMAAELTGALIILKGSETIIAAPDGRTVITLDAPPDLATAGSGDVLSGITTALLAQSMPAFEAACAAVWMHAEAARIFGPGLIADDLPEQLPSVLSELRA